MITQWYQRTHVRLIVITLGSLLALVLALSTIFTWLPTDNHCTAVLEFPIYKEVAVRSSPHSHGHGHPHPPHSDWHNYRLLHIGDRRLGPIRDVRGTIPVIFLHGHHGSYRSIQAMVSFHADLLAAPHEVRLEQSLEFFTIDYHEGSSAFHGALLWQQAWFLNECVSAIAALYRRPSVSVMIVGHSMGGLVARAAHLLPNYKPHSITNIITINAPHQSHPYLPDPSVSSFYSRVNHYWFDPVNRMNISDNGSGSGSSGSIGTLADVILISIVGGHRDTLIRSDLGSMHGIFPDSQSIFAFTTSIPAVLMATDHEASMWCGQLLDVMIRAMDHMARDIMSNNAVRSSIAHRMSVLRFYFVPYTSQRLHMIPDHPLHHHHDDYHRSIHDDEELRFIRLALSATTKPSSDISSLPSSLSPSRDVFPAVAPLSPYFPRYLSSTICHEQIWSHMNGTHNGTNGDSHGHGHGDDVHANTTSHVIYHDSAVPLHYINMNIMNNKTISSSITIHAIRLPMTNNNDDTKPIWLSLLTNIVTNHLCIAMVKPRITSSNTSPHMNTDSTDNKNADDRPNGNGNGAMIYKTMNDRLISLPLPSMTFDERKRYNFNPPLTPIDDHRATSMLHVSSHDWLSYHWLYIASLPLPQSRHHHSGNGNVPDSFPTSLRVLPYATHQWCIAHITYDKVALPIPSSSPPQPGGEPVQTLAVWPPASFSLSPSSSSSVSPSSRAVAIDGMPNENDHDGIPTTDFPAHILAPGQRYRASGHMMIRLPLTVNRTHPVPLLITLQLDRCTPLPSSSNDDTNSVWPLSTLPSMYAMIYNDVLPSGESSWSVSDDITSHSALISAHYTHHWSLQHTMVIVDPRCSYHIEIRYHALTSLSQILRVFGRLILPAWFVFLWVAIAGQLWFRLTYDRYISLSAILSTYMLQVLLIVVMITWITRWMMIWLQMNDNGYDPSLFHIWLLYVFAFALLIICDVMVSLCTYITSSITRACHHRLPHQWRIQSTRFILFGKCRLRATRAHQSASLSPSSPSPSSSSLSLPLALHRSGSDSGGMPMRRLGSYNSLRAPSSSSMVSFSSSRSYSMDHRHYRHGSGGTSSGSGNGNGNGDMDGDDDNDNDSDNDYDDSRQALLGTSHSRGSGSAYDDHYHSYESVDYRERDRDAPTPTSLSSSISLPLPLSSSSSSSLTMQPSSQPSLPSQQVLQSSLPLSPNNAMIGDVTTVTIAPSSPSEGSRRLYRATTNTDDHHNHNHHDIELGYHHYGHHYPSYRRERDSGSTMTMPRSPSMSSSTSLASSHTMISSLLWSMWSWIITSVSGYQRWLIWRYIQWIWQRRIVHWLGIITIGGATLFYPYIMLGCMLLFVWLNIIATATVYNDRPLPPLPLPYHDATSSHVLPLAAQLQSQSSSPLSSIVTSVAASQSSSSSPLSSLSSTTPVPLTSSSSSVSTASSSSSSMVSIWSWQRSELSVYQQTVMVMYILLMIIKAPSLLLSGELSLRVQWDLTVATNGDGLLVLPMMCHLWICRTRLPNKDSTLIQALLLIIAMMVPLLCSTLIYRTVYFAAIVSLALTVSTYRT